MVDDLEFHTCGECGIRFGAPKTFFDARRADSKMSWHCPNGHVRVFRESEADKLRRERDRLKQETARLEQGIQWQREQREAAERRVSAARGQITKLKKRAANGVCPCCNRTFVDLQRHMATKHSGFLAEEILPEGALVQ